VAGRVARWGTTLLLSVLVCGVGPPPAAAALRAGALSMEAAVGLGVAPPRVASEADPSRLSFDGLVPGRPVSREVTLRVDEESDGTVVLAEVQGEGDVVPYLTTGLRGCRVAWAGDRCPSGERELLAPAPIPRSRTIAVPVAATDTLYLSVSLQVADDVPQGITGSLTYHLRLTGGELAPPSPNPGSSPSPPPTPTPTPTPELRPPQQPPHPPLARTGAQIAAMLLAGVSLLGLGAAIRLRARSLRRRVR
jgi:hypothetical protein